MQPDEFKSLIAEKFKASGGLPYLFVGSGLSRRYLGIEDWQGLLDRFAQKLGKPVQRYQANTTLEVGESELLRLPKAGTLIANDFIDYWFSSPEYKSQVEKFKNISGSFDRPLKIAISEYIKERTLDFCAEDSELQVELQFLRQARTKGIITTNYDTLLEQLFPDFTPFVGQNDLITSQLTFVHDIYKIHGSVSDPSSLILVYEDYRKFMEINKYLVAKLLTIFVENPIVFLGYSVSDLNIQEILSDIMRITSDREFIRSKIQDKIFIVEWHPELLSPEITTIHKSVTNVQIPMTLVKVPNFIDLFQVISELPETVPQAVLKYVLQNLYTVKEASEGLDGRKTVVLIDQESYSSENINNLEIVIGFGIQEKIMAANKGMIGVETTDLVNDILNNSLSKSFPPENIISIGIEQRYLPEVHTNIPICKYLKSSGRFASKRAFANLPNVRRIFLKAYAKEGLKGFYGSPKIAKARRDFANSLITFDDFIFHAKLDNEFFNNLCAIAEIRGIDFIDSQKLHAALVLTKPEMSPTYWSKLICMVDKLLYFPWNIEEEILAQANSESLDGQIAVS